MMRREFLRRAAALLTLAVAGKAVAGRPAPPVTTDGPDDYWKDRVCTWYWDANSQHWAVLPGFGKSNTVKTAEFLAVERRWGPVWKRLRLGTA